MKQITNPCTCKTCKDMCQRPCWPTPEEAQELINAGYGSKLMLDYWSRCEYDEETDTYLTNIEILSPALYGYAGRSAPWWPTGKCSLQDDDGLCELHDKDLKPIEGRLCSCDESVDVGKLHEDIAMMWDTEEARKIVDCWRREFMF